MVLTRTLGIRDSISLMPTVRGGDSPAPTGQHLFDDLSPQGETYDPIGNLHPTARPGAVSHAPSIGIALAGYRVEVHAETSFGQQCHDAIFETRWMDGRAWSPANLDTTQIAIPHVWCGDHQEPFGHTGATDHAAGQLKAGDEQAAASQ